MDESLKTEAAKVRGCMSQVWMVLGWDGEGKLTLAADSDAQIVKGLIAVLEAMFVGKTAAEAAALDVEKTFQRLGMDQHISPNRRNGFFSMVEAVRAFTSRRT
jgi:cysteine desulfuration protein SufE